MKRRRVFLNCVFLQLVPNAATSVLPSAGSFKSCLANLYMLRNKRAPNTPELPGTTSRAKVRFGPLELLLVILDMSAEKRVVVQGKG